MGLTTKKLNWCGLKVFLPVCIRKIKYCEDTFYKLSKTMKYENKIIRRSRSQGGQGLKEVKISKIMTWLNKLHLYWLPGLNLSWQFQKLPCLQLESFPHRSLVTTVSFTGLQDNQTDHWTDAIHPIWVLSIREMVHVMVWPSFIYCMDFILHYCAYTGNQNFLVTMFLLLHHINNNIKQLIIKSL